MTPEERFDKIENVLHIVGQDMDKQNEAIRSLIVVARTVLDSIKETREKHDAAYQKLLEAQTATDEKLNILVEHEDVLDRTMKSLAETVERILRKDNGQK
jgi:hypothetical protein